MLSKQVRLLACTAFAALLLMGADACGPNVDDDGGVNCDLQDCIEGDGDGDGDREVINQGDGDGDGDGFRLCRSDADCRNGQACRLPECAPCGSREPGREGEDPGGDGLREPCDEECPAGVCVDGEEPDLCAVVECADGYHCEVEEWCNFGDPTPGGGPDCDPNEGDCPDEARPAPPEECFEEAICLPDEPRAECIDDSDCPADYHCAYHGGGAAPCFDENGDGECDEEPVDDFVWGGVCEPDDQPPACALIACAPGYVCQEQVECFPCDCVDEDCSGCDGACEVIPTCVPVNNQGCFELTPEQCEDAPGCALEEVYPPCAPPDPDSEEPPPNCDPVLVCSPSNGDEGSCAGHCGGPGSNNECFCDEACLQAGDCCSDFVEMCQEVTPTGCMIDTDCPGDLICELREWCFDDLGNGEECFVEGNCVEQPEPDPCNEIDLDLCEETEGCMLAERMAPCEVEPGGVVECPDEPQLFCILEPPPMGECRFDSDCIGANGDQGMCIEETLCLDWCDQTVPDPECCETVTSCVYEDEPDCIQVETEATNPLTGNCIVFPTPCDVPDTWILGCENSGG